MDAEASGAGVMTRQHFDLHVNRLAVLRNIPDAIDEWWIACQSVDPAVFEAACAHALKSRTFFPVPAELLADCDAVKALAKPIRPEAPQYTERDLEHAPTVEIKNPFGGASIFVKLVRDWHHDCDVCMDTGWAFRECPESHCGRRKEHGAHAFVERCQCIEWNPTIRRRKEAGLKYAAEKAA